MKPLKVFHLAGVTALVLSSAGVAHADWVLASVQPGDPTMELDAANAYTTYLDPMTHSSDSKTSDIFMVQRRFYWDASELFLNSSTAGSHLPLIVTCPMTLTVDPASDGGLKLSSKLTVNGTEYVKDDTYNYGNDTYAEDDDPDLSGIYLSSDTDIFKNNVTGLYQADFTYYVQFKNDASVASTIGYDPVNDEWYSDLVGSATTGDTTAEADDDDATAFLTYPT